MLLQFNVGKMELLKCLELVDQNVTKLVLDCLQFANKFKMIWPN